MPNRQQSRTTSATSVLFIRQLPQGCTEDDLRAFGQPFGRIAVALKVPTRDLGFIEFDDRASAEACFRHYQSTSAMIRGHVVDVKYSSRSLVFKPSATCALDTRRASPVLLVTMMLPVHLVECDLLAQSFSQFGGRVLRVVIFEKDGHTQGLIELASSQEAAAAKQALDGQSVFPHACVMKVQFSDRSSLQVNEGRNSRDYSKMGGSYNEVVALPIVSHATAYQPGSPPGLPRSQPRSRTVATSVLFICNLDEELAGCWALFVLCGVYGDVLRVKRLFRDRSRALVQFRDPQQAATARRFLHGLLLWGRYLRASPSTLTEVKLALHETTEDAELTCEFGVNHPLHRFRVPGSKNFQHLAPPSPALHVSNLPEGASGEDIAQLFAIQGDVEMVEFFPTTRKMAVVRMRNLDAAINALIALHGHRIETSVKRLSGVEGKGISVSFSAKASEVTSLLSHAAGQE